MEAGYTAGSCPKGTAGAISTGIGARAESLPDFEIASAQATAKGAGIEGRESPRLAAPRSATALAARPTEGGTASPAPSPAPAPISARTKNGRAFRASTTSDTAATKV